MSSLTPVDLRAAHGARWRPAQCSLTAILAAAVLVCGTWSALSARADELQDINALYKGGKRAEALGQVDTFLQRNPRDARARFLKGVILAEQNRTKEAVAVFSALTQDFPELPEPYNNLAVLYAGQGDYDKAREALEMAIRTHPSYAVAHENLGDIYAALASQAYDKALQLDGSNTTARKKLALIRELVPTRAQPQANVPAAPAQGMPQSGDASKMPAATQPGDAASKPVAPVLPAPSRP